MNFTLFNKELGNADLFLIDQILKGRFNEGTRVLDAGCGEGRNLNYFLQNKFEVYAIDKNLSALRMFNFTVRMLNSAVDPEHIIHGNITEYPFTANFYDYIICISVLHFAESKADFNNMINCLLNALKIDGIMILGMNSTFGNEKHLLKSDTGLYQMPDGSIRFLLDEEMMSTFTNNQSLEIIEPVKTLVIHDRESQSNLILKKVK